MIEAPILPQLWSKKLLKELIRPGLEETLDNLGRKTESFYGGEKMKEERTAGWVSVRERWPGKDKPVLVTDGEVISVASFDCFLKDGEGIDHPNWSIEGATGSDADFPFRDEDITHWMELPALPSPPLPRWKCHKVVEAFKIRFATPFENDFYTLLQGAAGTSEVVKVHDSYINKHRPEVGGYYVRYEDGYESYSPAEAFEKGKGIFKVHPTEIANVFQDVQEAEKHKGGAFNCLEPLEEQHPPLWKLRDKINEMIYVVNELGKKVSHG